MKKLYFILASLLLFGCQGINEPDPSKPKPDPTTDEITVKTPEVVLNDVKESTTIVEFTANTQWVIETADAKATPDWFEVSPMSGEAGEIMLNVIATKYNEDNNDRIAYINIETDKMKKQITVTQKAGNLTYIEVNIKDAGTLSELLAETDLFSITALRLQGVMNNDDFEFFKCLPNIRALDIENVENEVIPNTLCCNTLVSVKLPKNLKIIDQEAFIGCEKLQSITIPASVAVIYDGAFNGCHNLSNVTFEPRSKLKTLYGFENCASLTSITIPSSVETIVAFSGCYNLSSLSFGNDSNLKFLSGFSSCYSLFSVSIPVNVKTIGAYAFSESSLTTVTIPASVEFIKYRAFQRCSNLENVIFESGSKLISISVQCFNNCTSLTSVKIPASVETISAFDGCEKLASVTFEAGSKLATIGDNKMMEKAFVKCTSLTSITIPASVKTLDAFDECSSLANVTFEAGSQLKSLFGFYKCFSLTTVDASKCQFITTIGSRAFDGCLKLNLFKIGAVTPPTSGDAAFNGINSDAKLKVPASSIEAYKAVDGWKNFASITALDE